jgi:hypothetical protein
MELLNLSPFAAEAFRQMDAAGSLFGVVAIRGTFALHPDQPMVLATSQLPFVWEDLYADDGTGPYLISQSDFVPHKPGTDVTVLAEAHAPDGAPVDRIECGVRINGRLEKRLTVHGPRRWIARREEQREGLVRRTKKITWNWDLGSAEPVMSAPVSWTRAVGGLLPAGDGGVNADNPVGCGLVCAAGEKMPPSIAAPQVESPHAPIRNWHEMPQPEGFAPISPAWDLRLRHAGTYDAAWLANRHPLPPEDFDFRFWQCAHPDLIATPHLQGDEGYALGNLHEHYRVLTGFLPGCFQKMRVHWPDGHQDLTLALDGVHFDLRGGALQAVLTWRRAVPLYGVDDLRVVLRTVDAQGRRWAGAGEQMA